MRLSKEPSRPASALALTDMDRHYLAALKTRPAYFTVQQSEDLFDSVRAMYVLQLQRDESSLQGRALDIAVARRMYAADPAALRLIDLAEANYGPK